MKAKDIQKNLDKLAVIQNEVEQKRDDIGALNNKLDHQYEYIEHCTINLAKANSDMTTLRNQYFKAVTELKEILERGRIGIMFVNN